MENDDAESISEAFAKQYENDPEFVAEGLAISFVEDMLECLEKKDLNQSWLAEQMGVSRAHVSRILNARPNMTLLTIAKIAIALGVKPDVVLDTSKDKHQPPSIKAPENSDETANENHPADSARPIGVYHYPDKRNPPHVRQDVLEKLTVRDKPNIGAKNQGKRGRGTENKTLVL
jgi:plasmid maintenance system antidote protein VapI